MSLSDLRKVTATAPVMLCTVDEFIDNAQLYARGFDNVVNLTIPAANNSAAPSLAVEKQPYRKATFTLSEECIELLTQQAEFTNCSKSHLVRMLIHQFSDAPVAQQQLMLNRYSR